MGMDLQKDTYEHGVIDRHLFAFTYRQTLMGMEFDLDFDFDIDRHLWMTYRWTQTIMGIYVQIHSYGHRLIDRHLWAFTYRQTLMGMDLELDLEFYLEFGLGLGLGIGLGLGRNWTWTELDLDGIGFGLGLGHLDRHLCSWTYRQIFMGTDLQIDTYDHGLIDRHLWAFTYRWTLMGMDLQTLMILDLQIDTYGHGLIDRH